MIEKKLVIKGDLKKILRSYLTLTKPLNKLSKQEVDVLVFLLHMYFTEKPNFKNEEDLWKKLFHHDTRLDIQIELDMKTETLNSTFTRLRNKNAFIGRKINPIFVPQIDDKTNSFKISYNFFINDGYTG